MLVLLTYVHKCELNNSTEILTFILNHQKYQNISIQQYNICLPKQATCSNK